MANVQKQFDEFDGKIRLGRFDEEKTLREKRDIIRKKLRERLPEVFKLHDEDCLEFSFHNQGSYELGTGVKPLDGDYDIDQGLYFKASTSDYPDPVVLKKRVHEALDGHTDSVLIRRPCVTVQYRQGDEPLYHVDVAVYSDGSENGDGKSRLALGKENSAADFRKWELSDPQGLVDKIHDRFSGNDKAQFRRCVRYLKRWRDEKFTSQGNGTPVGIGLTVAAYDDLSAVYMDAIAGTPDDLIALRNLIRDVFNRFTQEWDAEQEKFVKRLKVTLPVEPYNDLFARMTQRQMEEFEKKLERLLEALNYAVDEVDPHDACKELCRVFGDDFPVPDKSDTAKRHSAAIVSTSGSA
ncbi:MAG: nucleotidyltransferase [Dehalococcoidia bacterium]